MAIGGTLLIVAVLIAAIWLIIEMKGFRHKIFAILLIGLILFTYVSFVSVVKNKDIDLKSIEGMKQGGKLYLSWLGSVFSNIKTITSSAIDMNWTFNKTNLSNYSDGK